MSKKYTPTIGLEVHVELDTESKMFCDCRNDPDEARPNVNVCPVCMGHPGTLPVPNKKALELIIKVGLALGGTIPDISKFDRKNYFYPDLPKGYQISQYDLPIVSGGELNGVKLERIHLEEDAGRLVHYDKDHDNDSGEESQSHGYRQKLSSTLVDFNRAGIPLMELVTKPVMHDTPSALGFAEELQRVLRYMGASEANLEKGEMRFDANISLMATNLSTNNTNGIRDIGGHIGENSRVLGTKVEIKNLNSFKSLQDALNYEMTRQEELLEEGKEVTQETRGWDDKKQKTVSQRSKESAHDYRYFPEPDIPPLRLHEAFDLDALRNGLPELPSAKLIRFAAGNGYGVTAEQAAALADNKELADYFEHTASEYASFYKNAKKEMPGYTALYNYLTSDLRGLMNETATPIKELKFTPEHFAHLVYFAETGKVGSRAAKDILRKMFETGLDPEEILNNEGLAQVSDESALIATVDAVIAENEGPVADYKKGKGNVLQFLIGRAMGKLKGAGNPQILAKLFKKRIGE